MVSLPSDRTKAQAKPNELVPAAKTNWLAGIDTDLVFRLIDSILPFEACLYHQILPLSLEGSRLKLGVVNLDDTTALDYVRRILAYMNCSLTPQTVASEVHQAVLTAYLNYTGSKRHPASSKRAAQPSLSQRIEKKLATGVTKPSTAENNAAEQRSEGECNPQNRQHSNRDQNNAPTLLVDSPEELLQDLEAANPQTLPPILSTPDTKGKLADTLHDNLDKSSADAFTGLDNLKASQQPLPSAPAEISAYPRSSESLPVLQVEPKHLSDPVEVLATLSPRDLLGELLGRVFIGGIGRLYFEQQQQHGRILWSQDGVLQSILEKLPNETIQGVINELKLLACLSLIPVQKPKQVEIERLYQKQRLLLRLRVMPGTHGEEATLQVLRGAALKFYQQQQLASLSRDALSTAQELQRKVNEIRVRTRFYSTLSPEQLSVLPALGSVLKSVEQQLEALKGLPIAASEEEQ